MKHNPMNNTLTSALAVLLLTPFMSCSTTEKPDETPAIEGEKTKTEKVISTEVFPDGKYTVDQKQSTFSWEGKEASGHSHTGEIKLYKGSVNIMNSEFYEAYVGIDMNSINCTDLEGGAKERLEGHLKSEDFFGTDKYPYSTIEITSTKTKGEVTKAVGTLTIKGIAQPIVFPTTLSLKDENIVIDGTLVFDRSLFDVRFRSDKWYSNLGDKLIYNDIELTYHIVASIQ